MSSILKSLRLAADPNRLRILLVLEQEELSVAELQEILSKGQSQISMHLAQLKQVQPACSGLVVADECLRLAECACHINLAKASLDPKLAEER